MYFHLQIVTIPQSSMAAINGRSSYNRDGKTSSTSLTTTLAPSPSSLADHLCAMTITVIKVHLCAYSLSLSSIKSLLYSGKSKANDQASFGPKFKTKQYSGTVE